VLLSAETYPHFPAGADLDELPAGSGRSVPRVREATRGTDPVE
jgi:hypothetical protein